MPLAPGARVGPYEIAALIGAGGMGEVYRARDTRLGRDVAVKVLPASFAADGERLQRFEQEARALAALSHPNILALYDVGEHAGAPYLVSELVEGDTLRARLAAPPRPPSRAGAGQSHERPLAVRKAVEYAAQMARGLAAAHARGIVHRDLKPENVVVTPDGRVKILDFGLARLGRPTMPDKVETVTVGTAPGTVLGTVGYMAPEQVRGAPADHRSDIFALGAIFYEMLAGRRAFEGASSADMMSAILNDQPSNLPPPETGVPAALSRIVERCLEKRPEARFQSADDLAFALESFSTASDAGSVTAAGRRRSSWPVRASVAALLVLAASAMPLWYSAPANVERDVVRFMQPPPEGFAFSLQSVANFMAVSPDGRRLAFTAAGASGVASLWIRELGQLEARMLPGTENARHPFWSPDGRFIGFYGAGVLRKVAVDGGASETICEVITVPTGGTWSRDNVILMSFLAGPIHRVSANGGEPTPVTTRASSSLVAQHSHPEFLPDGRRFLYYVHSADHEQRGVYVKALDSEGTTLVPGVTSNARYVEIGPGYLLYARNGALLAQAFDAAQARMTGDPVVLADHVDYIAESGLATFAASSNAGVVVYRASEEAGRTRLRWVSRDGTVQRDIGEPAPYRNPRLSPDGSRIAVELVDRSGNRDIHIMDAERGVPVRFTFGPGRDAAAVWSRPDGRYIAWQESTATLMRPSTGGTEQVIHKEPWIPDDWLPDGSGLLFHPFSPRQVWLLPLTGADRRPRPIIEGRQITTHARVSSDGNWVAFANTDSGRFEVYLQNFPVAAGRWPVSTDGGIQPKWRNDGKELFYLAFDGTLMSVPLSLGPLPEIGKPQRLFQTGIEGTTGYTWHQYDVSPDGQRFLINAPETAASPLTVVVNWPASIRR